MLANLESTAGKLLSVVLSGQPELAQRLNEPQLRPFKQRVALRTTLPAFGLQETAGYIAARVRAAGGSAAHLFSSTAVEGIHRASRGIARTISVIGDNALIAAFALRQPMVTDALVGEVCADLDLELAPTMPASHPLAALAAAVVRFADNSRQCAGDACQSRCSRPQVARQHRSGQASSRRRRSRAGNRHRVPAAAVSSRCPNEPDRRRTAARSRAGPGPRRRGSRRSSRQAGSASPTCLATENLWTFEPATPDSPESASTLDISRGAAGAPQANVGRAQVGSRPGRHRLAPGEPAPGRADRHSGQAPALRRASTIGKLAATLHEAQQDRGTQGRDDHERGPWRRQVADRRQPVAHAERILPSPRPADRRGPAPSHAARHLPGRVHGGPFGRTSAEPSSAFATFQLSTRSRSCRRAARSGSDGQPHVTAHEAADRGSAGQVRLGDHRHAPGDADA